MNNVVMSNVNGKVTAEEGKVTIPQGRLALSMFANNPFIPGTDYNQDGWIYDAAGNRIRKWFTKLENIVLWEPTLNNPSVLERRFRKVMKRNKQILKEHADSFDLMKATGEAHAQPTHRFEVLTDGRTWWFYTVDEHGISFDWVKKPNHPKNLAIGTRYYNATQRLRCFNTRAGKLLFALEVSLIRRLPCESLFAELVEMKVNGKSYWMRKYTPSIGNPYWKLFAYPGSGNSISVKV